ncbi:MAG: SAP domain-containing protein [Methanomassiliicoccaceae archaeon]|nr:SAP domain-containing protein [Methanomassiliicoccaceae archaeon]
MTERPVLSNNTDPKIFGEYYYLKEELTAFCRSNGLQTTGSKAELTERVRTFLSTGERTVIKRTGRNASNTGAVTEGTVIGPGVVCSQRLRDFFLDKIGSSFKFNIEFLKWLRSNPESTYSDAVTAYGEILEERKGKRSIIGRQFEYNTYIREFFDENPGMTLDDAIRCWKHKKSLPGSNRYEKDDLSAIGR